MASSYFIRATATVTPPARCNTLASATPVTRIGHIEAAPGLRLTDAHGQPLAQQHYASFDHFA